LPFGVRDIALTLNGPDCAETGRDIEMHLVGVVQCHAAGLARNCLDRIVSEGLLQFEENRKRSHVAKAPAELRDDIEIVFVVRPADRYCGVDGHRALRVKMFDEIGELWRLVELAPNRGVAFIHLIMQRRRQLQLERNLRQEPASCCGRRRSAPSWGLGLPRSSTIPRNAGAHAS